MTSYPVIIAFPFLPLAEPVEFDKWWLGPASSFGGQWFSEDFKELAWTFLLSFQDSVGGPIKNPALLAQRNDGISGTRPSHRERESLRKAILFSTIDRNDYWTSDSNMSTSHVTADNTDYWEQPLDINSGSILLERGARVRTQIFGQRLSAPGSNIRATTETVMPQCAIHLDNLLVDALYEILMRLEGDFEEQTEERAPIERLSTAISWLEKTWLNTPSIGWEDRLVFLKTAFEALTGFPQTQKASKKLKSIIESTEKQEGSELELRTLLWRPDEGTRIRSFNGKRQEVTEIEHWYGALADARNKVIHEGTVPNLHYEEPDSAYNGHLVETGDRVLREAVKVEMGNLGYPEAWRDTFGRGSLHMLRDFGES